MGTECIVVADNAKARFFTVGDSDAPRAPHVLVEGETLENPSLRVRGASVTGRPRTETNTNREAGPMHPIQAQRERHRLELTRRFAGNIADRAAELLAGAPEATLLLIAEPRLLSMICEAAHRSLDRDVQVKELARDFGGLSRTEIQRRLEAERALG